MVIFDPCGICACCTKAESTLSQVQYLTPRPLHVYDLDDLDARGLFAVLQHRRGHPKHRLLPRPTVDPIMPPTHKLVPSTHTATLHQNPT